VKPSRRTVDRAAELVAAARVWRAAGLVDEPTLAAITAEDSPAGPRLGPTWRILVFGCVVAGVLAFTAIAFFSFKLRDAATVGGALLILGLALAFATDIVVDRCSFRPTGAEAATSLLAAGYLCAAVFVLLDDLKLPGAAALRLTYSWCAAVFALAAWRWGFRIYGGIAAVFVLLLAAQFPAARLVWIAAALLAAWAARTLRTRDLPPAHRDGVELARVVALAAIYVAVNYFSVKEGLVEEIGRVVGTPHHRADDVSLLLAGIGSALYPLALVVRGLRSRDRVLTDLGIAAAALSLTTLLSYAHVEPLWAVLAVAGAALAGTSLFLERWLHSGADGERCGYTAAPLDDERHRERLLPVAAVITIGPEARAGPDERPDFSGRGGSFGGGGASGSVS
jgi:hypothetical protein